MMGKGQDFEREVCKLLSEWWTNGERNDIFWRSSGSGARAKVRGRRGQSTYGQHGDICMTDPIGRLLIEMFTIELKRGYTKFTIGDLLDCSATAKLQPWEQWFLQAIESSEHAESFAWLLITRRTRRVPIIFMPYKVITGLQSIGALTHRPEPSIVMKLFIPFNRRNGAGYVEKVAGQHLDTFLKEVTPLHIKKLFKVI